MDTHCCWTRGGTQKRQEEWVDTEEAYTVLL